MSETQAPPTSLDAIADDLSASDGPSPVPPVLKAPARKRSAATAKAAQIVSQESATVEPSAEPAVRSVKETSMDETIQSTTDKTKTMFAEASERAKAQMEKGARAFEDMNAFGKGNVEAIVESSKIAAKGFEQMGQDAASYMKSSYENATTAFKSMTAVKSPTELFQLQSDFARSYFDAFVAQTSRSTEAALKLAGEIAQPISNRVAIAVEKVKVAA
ncbi:phasin family protein [Sphingomonas jeddahensis]|uniref:Phasin protein n=1 Tax=Sphingomonas jeddahensis TaxID=1915074 RepID=A0A1V2ESZ1_9SPHN|nr:phasin family protein [Sphingomonas jeddahensis]ONF95595.1 Phasin protein [Sphingomonas jeddahensis]